MCGRYSLTTAPEAMRRLFEFDNLPNLAPRYNIAPTQLAPVVRRHRDGPGRELVLLRWGLIPSWSKDASGGARMINARADTAAEKPAFRAAFRARRCLVPADGFYEWRTEEGRKQPFRIGFKGGAAFAFAGLWESWTVRDGPEVGTTIETYAVLTTDANAKLSPIHDRMPVILPPADWAAWHDPATPAEAAQAMLRPHPPEPMAFYRVSLRVNSVRNDDAECIAPLNPPSA
ncbi:MAG: SOS response-associated peptidase [Rhodospirillales bacterium]